MKIRLVCSAGMSTSMLVNKMRQVAEERGMEADIDAIGQADLKSHLDGTDVILVGPQVRYLEKKIRQDADPLGIAVDVIDSVAYGLMQGDKVLDQAISLKNK